MKYRVVALALLIAVVSACDLSARTWTDKSGSFRIEATLGAVDKTHAHLKKPDGTVVKVPLEKLSPADLQFVKKKLQAEGERETSQQRVSLERRKPGVDYFKAATALVDLKERGSGSAFCIKPDGWFVTNRHVVEGTPVGGIVDVVLAATDADEVVAKARVVSISRTYDLALLKVDGAQGLPTLKLGRVDRLNETMTIAAIGYPFGKSLAADVGGYPAVSVNTGKIRYC
jgi:S1-C subfamily serine protease